MVRGVTTSDRPGSHGSVPRPPSTRRLLLEIKLPTAINRQLQPSIRLCAFVTISFASMHKFEKVLFNNCDFIIIQCIYFETNPCGFVTSRRYSVGWVGLCASLVLLMYCMLFYRIVRTLFTFNCNVLGFLWICFTLLFHKK